MAPVKCSYFGCLKNSANSSMFRFPTGNQKRLELWLTHCAENISPLKVKTPTKVYERKRVNRSPENLENSESELDYPKRLKRTRTNDAESDSNYVCNECNGPITGGRFMCAQCADYDLCARCAGEGAAHPHHYLLRVPPHRPPEEVHRVLQTLRSMLCNDSDADKPSADEDEDEVEIKTEVVDEFEAKFDPLGITVEEQPADEHLTLKRTMPIASTETQDTHKRTKQDSGNINDAMTGPARESNDDIFTVLPNVKCEQDEPPATLICRSTMANSLTRIAATAPVATDTISQTQAPTLATPQSTQAPTHTRPSVANLYRFRYVMYR